MTGHSIIHLLTAICRAADWQKQEDMVRDRRIAISLLGHDRIKTRKKQTGLFIRQAGLH